MQDQQGEPANTDGTLLPIDAMAVRPYLEEDLAELVAQVPVCLAMELARMAAWRAMGMALPPETNFKI